MYSSSNESARYKDMDEIQTYWLYFGTRVLTAVRLPIGTSDNEVLARAIDNEFRCPIGHKAHEAPFEFQNRLHNAEVRVFN